MSHPRYNGNYTPQAYDLAALFIDQEARTDETKDRCRRLANHVQSAVDDWLRSNPPKLGIAALAN